MIRELVTSCSCALLAVGCAGVFTTDQVDAPDTTEFVERIRDYAHPRHVPARFQHLVRWHTETGHVVLLMGVGGRRACAVTPSEATKVIANKPYRCRWRAAR